MNLYTEKENLLAFSFRDIEILPVFQAWTEWHATKGPKNDYSTLAQGRS